MLDVERLLLEHRPYDWLNKSALAKPLVGILRALFHERELQQLAADWPHQQGFEFVEKLLDWLGFSYRLRGEENQRIPRAGRVVIIANHPIGTLDGLVLLNIVRAIRPDVKVLANEVLSAVKPLSSVILPVNNMGGNTSRDNLRAVGKHIENHGALIVFPAGEVSRLGAQGVRDGKWRPGFLRIAYRHKAPVLPVFIDARNSAFFYALSFLAKPLSTLWLVHEMFKQARRCVDIRIGEPLKFADYQRIDIPLDQQARLFRRHVYRIGRDRPGLFSGPKAIAHPEHRTPLRREIRECQLLGETDDHQQIYLYEHGPDSCIMREIGRLRELAFRAVAEGTGESRDVDTYDAHYRQLLLWDDEAGEIIGGYRLCSSAKQHTSPTSAMDGDYKHLYSTALFEYTDSMKPYLEQGLELGRSFIQPKYWGKRRLDCLWIGIGAFLRTNPQYRYLLGPVSLSDALPLAAKDMLVFFYQQHFKTLQPVARARNPYHIGSRSRQQLAGIFPGIDYRAEFVRLKRVLADFRVGVPTLYKQYSELCDPGGVQFADFNVDPHFADCVDGLVIVDLARLKTRKRQRYIG